MYIDAPLVYKKNNSRTVDESESQKLVEKDEKGIRLYAPVENSQL